MKEVRFYIKKNKTKVLWTAPVKVEEITNKVLARLMADISDGGKK